MSEWLKEKYGKKRKAKSETIVSNEVRILPKDVVKLGCAIFYKEDFNEAIEIVKKHSDWEKRFKHKVKLMPKSYYLPLDHLFIEILFGSADISVGEGNEIFKNFGNGRYCKGTLEEGYSLLLADLIEMELGQ